MSAYEIQVLEGDGVTLAQTESDLIISVVEYVLHHYEQPADTELCILVTLDEQIRELNREYRDVDAPTDVLSFSSFEGEPFVLPEGMPVNLGDIVISLPQMQRQALAAGRRAKDELALLVVHGCLHLLGYDHADAEQQHEMWHKQDELLAEMGYAPGPSEFDFKGVDDDAG